MHKPRIWGYEIHNVIGKGAGSKIFRATHRKTRKAVSIKHVSIDVIHERLADVGEHLPAWEHHPINHDSYFHQLRVEYDILQRLAKTPVSKFVPEVYALRPIRRWFFKTVGYDLIMEYIPGQTLAEKRQHPIRAIVRFYDEAARILYGMHRMGVLHSDLKPQHLMITPEGHLKLLDFGQCRRSRDDQQRIQGTPFYMAPEQLRGGIVDERTDIYCLGASFYWILTGKSIHPVVSTAKISVGVPMAVGFSHRGGIREDNPATPEVLERLILESCEPRMTDRPNSMREVFERLEPLLR
jgi:serine/threonine-protein kinase